LPKLHCILFHIVICSHDLGISLGLEHVSFGLGHGLANTGLGLGLETAGLGLSLGLANIGLGLGLATAGLDYKTATL